MIITDMPWLDTTPLTEPRREDTNATQELSDLLTANTTRQSATDLGDPTFVRINVSDYLRNPFDAGKYATWAFLTQDSQQLVLALATVPTSQNTNEGNIFYFDLSGRLLGYSEAKVDIKNNSLGDVSEMKQVFPNEDYIWSAKILLRHTAEKIRERYASKAGIEKALQGSLTHATQPITQVPSSQRDITSNTQPIGSYIGVGSAAVIGTLLLAYVANRLYHRKK